MGGKSRKSGGVSEALIRRLKAGTGCGNKPKNKKGGFSEKQVSKDGSESPCKS